MFISICQGAIKGSVKFRSVQFSYPSRSTVKVLKGIDIDVQPGLKIALVGSSGCGKSTVISLLERGFMIQVKAVWYVLLFLLNVV